MNLSENSSQDKPPCKSNTLRVLVVTSEWPSSDSPCAGQFVFRQVEALKNLGIRINVLHFRGRKNPIRYFKTLMKLRYMLRNNRFDLIHAHFGQAGFISILQNEVPVIVTFHGSDLFGIVGINFLDRLKSKLLRIISTVAAAKANEVIVVSDRLADKLHRRSKHIIPIGIDLSAFRPMLREKARASLRWPSNERTVLFVGDPLNPIKRYWLAAEAVKLTSRTIPNVKLRVCWKETQERVSEYMNASHVLVVTSIHEAGPLVVREAIACNLPVVSVDVGDVPQRIGSLEGCEICDDDQPETIAEALRRVVLLNKRISGRATVLDLDESLLSREIVELYQRALNSL